MERLIITAAICGAEVTRADTPYLPITPEELAEAALEAEQAGASIIHLHVKDEEGLPTQDQQVFALVIEQMKEVGVRAVMMSLSMICH